MPTRYLLDKVIVRYALDGMVSLSLGRTLSKEQLAALLLLHRSAPGQVELYLFNAMRSQLHSPYDHVQLPELQLLQ